MKYLILAVLALFTFPAHAEFDFGGTEIGKPQSMMVAGDSVIDEETTSDISGPQREQVRDDANDLMKPERTAPPTPEIDPFSPAPQTAAQQKRNVKRVLKKIPAAKVERSIADDRIDDGYVQQMLKNDFDFTGPIE